MVASEWVTSFESMAAAYLGLVAGGEWLRGPEDLFNMIGLGRNEVRHSTMIAWLFDPLARHGLDPGFLEAVLDEVFPDESHDVDGLITVETEVARGDTRADIVVWGKDFTLITETKVDAEEGYRQCDRLYEHFNTEPGALFLFLTPNGRPATTATGDAAEAFRPVSFPDLRALLAGAIGENDGDTTGVGRSTTHNYYRTFAKEFI